MSDATRKQAIAWCENVGADFYTPIYPPPKGWVRAVRDGSLVLTAIFTRTDGCSDITKSDVGMA